MRPKLDDLRKQDRERAKTAREAAVEATGRDRGTDPDDLASIAYRVIYGLPRSPMPGSWRW